MGIEDFTKKHKQTNNAIAENYAFDKELQSKAETEYLNTLRMIKKVRTDINMIYTDASDLDTFREVTDDYQKTDEEFKKRMKKITERFNRIEKIVNKALII